MSRLNFGGPLKSRVWFSNSKIVRHKIKYWVICTNKKKKYEHVSLRLFIFSIWSHTLVRAQNKDDPNMKMSLKIKMKMNFFGANLSCSFFVNETHTCIIAHLNTCLLAYLFICILAYFNTFIFAFLHTCILAYFHTCISPYFHTCRPPHKYRKA